MPEKQFEKVLINNLIAMQDVSLNPQTFCFSPLVKPYRQEYLKRLCERNQCKTAPQMSPEVDFLVTSPDTTSLELLKQRLGDIKPEALADEASLPPDRLLLARTFKMLTEGRKHGAKAISESQLEEFFLDRGRKKEMLAGQAKQPGQFVFYVVGETKDRSIRETNLYIKEHGGVIAAYMDDKVDYLVVGEGLNDAKWDKASRRIYFAGQQAPATAIPFSDAVKTMGLRILREEELPKFFGR
jgi:NAD-dependent DNA ligase